MADTGSTLRDAVNNMQTHLLLKQSTWGLKNVYKYPAYQLGGIGPALAIEVDDATIAHGEFGAGIAADWQIILRITYFTELLDAADAYDDVLHILGELLEYMLESPTPNAFGDLIVGNGTLGGTIGAIQNTTAGQQLFGGSVVITLEHTRQHTIS